MMYVRGSYFLHVNGTMFEEVALHLHVMVLEEHMEIKRFKKITLCFKQHSFCLTKQTISFFKKKQAFNFIETCSKKLPYLQIKKSPNERAKCLNQHPTECLLSG